MHASFANKEPLSYKYNMDKHVMDWNISYIKGTILFVLFFKLDMVLCDIILWFLSKNALKSQNYNKNILTNHYWKLTDFV